MAFHKLKSTSRQFSYLHSIKPNTRGFLYFSQWKLRMYLAIKYNKVIRSTLPNLVVLWTSNATRYEIR